MPRNSCIWPTVTPRTGPLSVATTGDFGAADARVGAPATALARTATTRMHLIRFDVIVVPPEVEFARWPDAMSRSRTSQGRSGRFGYHEVQAISSAWTHDAIRSRRPARSARS